jgi:DNA-binding NarL/FixJ family response regulator
MLNQANDAEHGRTPRPLTEREIEVLRFVTEGRTNKDIAQYLRIAIKTVEAHRARIKRKLGMQTVVELVHYAIKQGIVSVGTRDDEQH